MLVFQLQACDNLLGLVISSMACSHVWAVLQIGEAGSADALTYIA